MVTTGGTSLRDDIMRLFNTVHILVGTSGRILDLSTKGCADLSKAETVVMDEADKLLSPEFIPLMEKLVNSCKPGRQILVRPFCLSLLILMFSTVVFRHFSRDSEVI